MSPPAMAARPTARAEAQRDRILCAALRCFIEHGFHAASMANIADTAQMSAGLMYRYFENKNAIMLAIIERQLEEKRAVIRELNNCTNIVDRLMETFERLCAREAGMMSPALFLEMSAEATRNPQIAEALRSSDRQARAEIEAWLARSREDGGLGLSPEAAAVQAVAMHCFLDGMALRSVREPDLDRHHLRAAATKLFSGLGG